MKKICSKCKIEKDVTEFYKDNRRVDGRRPDCKSCRDLLSKKYQVSNKGKIAKQRKTYYDINRDKFLAYSKKYREKNKEKIYEYWNSDKGKEIKANYRKTEKGQASTARNNYNKFKRNKNTINNLTTEEKNIILFLQNYKCVDCNEYFDNVNPTLDHIIPLSKGGGLTKNNIQILCKSCNSKKYINDFDYRTETHKELIMNI